MSLLPGHEQELAALSPALRELLAAELAAGNAVVEVGHGFPAPPAGAYVLLARPVSTRPRASGGGLVFFERNMPRYSGEFTDERRFGFVLEPPRPPEPPPDMDAIRAGLAARVRAADQARQEQAERLAAGVVKRFRRSLQGIDYGKWHDGVGYDVELLAQATAEEREAIERLVLERGVEGWRDVEALAALDTPRARLALQRAAGAGTPEVRLAVFRHAPELLDETARTDILVDALERAEFYGGLTQALEEAELFHPPRVVDALFRGLLAREGSVAVHFAALLLFLHGQAAEAFDWAQRPYVLQFDTADPAARRALARDLCERLGVPAGRCAPHGERNP